MLKSNWKQKEKIFCIGRNKTGTTSLEKLLQGFGYKMGDQASAEILVNDYAKGDFNNIIRYCKTADAFQDAPFSWPFTWLILTQHFPNAKFILSTREQETWYHSISSFHTKLFSSTNSTPSLEDLKNASYRYKGFVWEVFQSVWKTPEDDLYNKDMMILNYRRHNEDILHFFKNKDNFIHIDVSNEKDYIKLCSFLNKQPKSSSFPHLNKTDEKV